MLLSTQTDYTSARFGYEKSVEIIAAAGFDAIDFSMFRMVKPDDILATDGWKDETERVRRAAEKAHIGFNQSHAPFNFPMHTDPEAYEKIVMPLTLRALEISSVLGVKIMVAHPIHYKDYRRSRDEMHDKSIAYYRSLIPYCKKFGVKVALENMWQRNKLTGYIETDTCSCAEEFSDWIDEIGSEWIVGCLDIGHCGLTGESASDAIRKIGNRRLRALHVHDNSHHADDHTLPGLGKIDWNEVTSALADIGYRGDFTFEADNFLRMFNDDFIPDALKFMERRGRNLIKMIEKNG